jgi:hypothetical protein
MLRCKNGFGGGGVIYPKKRKCLIANFVVVADLGTFSDP